MAGQAKDISSSPQKKVREKSRECNNHKPHPFPDPKRKRKPTNPNKHKLNKRTKSTKISSLFPKRGNRNTKRTEKHKNKMAHGKTYNKSPRRINHKATKSRTNTWTTALERSVEQTTGRNSTKFEISHSLMVRVCERNIILLCVNPSVRPSSIHLSVQPSAPKPLG